MRTTVPMKNTPSKHKIIMREHYSVIATRNQNDRKRIKAARKNRGYEPGILNVLVAQESARD